MWHWWNFSRTSRFKATLTAVITDLKVTKLSSGCAICGDWLFPICRLSLKFFNIRRFKIFLKFLLFKMFFFSQLCWREAKWSGGNYCLIFISINKVLFPSPTFCGFQNETKLLIKLVPSKNLSYIRQYKGWCFQRWQMRIIRDYNSSLIGCACLHVSAKLYISFSNFR